MAGLHRKSGTGKNGYKYLVQRRDGSVPTWPWFVLGALDPAAPAALRTYARAAAYYNMDPKYVKDIEELADEFARYQDERGLGDPDAPLHRKDDPKIVELLSKAGDA